MCGITEEGYTPRRVGNAGAEVRETGESSGAASSLTSQRKRSNSMPIPKIEVTMHGNNGTSNKELKEKEEDDEELEKGLNDDNSLMRRVRATSLGAKRRKKSLIGAGLEVTKFKHFKSFVESKILSKSDRSLENDDDNSGSGGTSGGGGGLTLAAVLAARDTFKRRCSRTSVSDFDAIDVSTV